MAYEIIPPKKKDRPRVAAEQIIQLLPPEETRELFIKQLRTALKDESTAEAEYEHLAREAEAAGYPEEAGRLREIARDESRHRVTLEEMIRRKSPWV